MQEIIADDFLKGDWWFYEPTFFVGVSNHEMMALRKKGKRSQPDEWIFRVVTNEGTFDLLKSRDTLHPGQYWMRRDQMYAFGDPQITEAIEQKRWRFFPIRDSLIDFVFCDEVTVGNRIPPKKAPVPRSYTIDELIDQIAV